MNPTLDPFGGKIIGEFQGSTDELLSREIAHRSRQISRGLFTRKGTELDGGDPLALRQRVLIGWEPPKPEPLKTPFDIRLAKFL